MGFGVGCLGNCCLPHVYNVCSVTHAAMGKSTRPNAEAVHEDMWDEARVEAWLKYSQGITPDPELGGWPMGQLPKSWAPGPCLIPTPESSPPPPLGWIEYRALDLKPWCKNFAEYLEGSLPCFWITDTRTVHPEFALRDIRGHARMASGGRVLAGGPTLEGFNTTAEAGIVNAAWLFIVGVDNDGISFTEQYNQYNHLEFELAINQCSGHGLPLDVPDLYQEYAEFDSVTRQWTTVNQTLFLDGFTIVVGNSVGLATILTEPTPNSPTIPQVQALAHLNNQQRASYWVTRRLLQGNYEVVSPIPPLPRDASRVTMRLTNISPGMNQLSALNWPGFQNVFLPKGLDTTTATEPKEQLYGRQHGAVWFLAIVPTAMCVGDTLPRDLTYNRIVNPLSDKWQTQMLTDHKIASLNVMKLFAGGTSGQQQQLVPFDYTGTGSQPTL